MHVVQVADFGLSTKMDHLETHVSSMFQGTLTHMVRSDAMRCVMERGGAAPQPHTAHTAHTHAVKAYMHAVLQHTVRRPRQRRMQAGSR